MNSKNVWKESKQKKVKAIDTFAKDYIDFISDNKTERECCDAAVSMLEEAGFKSIAYNITFRASDRTLEESDISAAMKKILNGLEGMGIELRQ